MIVRITNNRNLLLLLGQLLQQERESDSFEQLFAVIASIVAATPEERFDIFVGRLGRVEFTLRKRKQCRTFSKL